MSDAAIASIVTGVVTIATMVVGFLTMMVKLKYGVDQVEAVSGKVDVNTAITTATKESADKASEHVEGCNEERVSMLRSLADHDGRIKSLEVQMTALKVSVDSVSKDIASTRHEMRGHLQTLMTKLDLMMVAKSEPSRPAVSSGGGTG